MKKVHLYVWINSGEPFGVFESKKLADEALKKQADNIKTTLEDLKLDLYYYELPLNKLFIPSFNTILD